MLIAMLLLNMSDVALGKKNKKTEKSENSYDDVGRAQFS